MNTIENNPSYIPEFALIFNQSGPGMDYVITKHKLKKTITGYDIQKGELLTEKSYKKILLKDKKDSINSYEEVINDKALFPENLLIADKTNILWYSLPGLRKLMFSTSTGLKSGDYVVPGVLFHYSYNAGFKVYCFLEEHRPTLKTVLYQPVFLNCSVGGTVCLGTGMKKTDTRSIAAIVNNYNNAFWNSEFSEYRESTMKGSQKEHWKWKTQHRAAQFPIEALIPINVTLKAILK